MKTVYITLAVSLTAMAVLIAISGAWRRSVNTDDVPSTTEAMAIPDRQVIATQSTRETSEFTETEAAATVVTSSLESDVFEETEEPTAAEVLPEFMTPVSGYIIKGHSGESPVFSITMDDYRPHAGVDVYANIGDDVYAAADGIITDIWEDPMEGNCMSISHSGGAISVYRNLDPTLPDSIVVGAEVSAGQVVGSIGESSLVEIAEEPHLHFELSVDGEAVDPVMYIAFPDTASGYED